MEPSSRTETLLRLHSLDRRGPDRDGLDRHGLDRHGLDRSGQRSDAVRMMTRMHQLPPDDSERAGLRDRVIAEYMHYARHLLTRYGIPFQAAEDFQQVAYVGLIKAVDGFDPEQGTAFLTYATPTILGEVRRHFSEGGAHSGE